MMCILLLLEVNVFQFNSVQLKAFSQSSLIISFFPIEFPLLTKQLRYKLTVNIFYHKYIK